MKKEKDYMVQAILRALEGKPKLSENKGRIILNTHCPSGISKKDKRHSGWITSRYSGKGKYSEEILNANDATYHYDEWLNYRDGYRGKRDRSQIYNEYYWPGRPNKIKKNNNKLKIMLKRRQVMKQSQSFKDN